MTLVFQRLVVFAGPPIMLAIYFWNVGFWQAWQTIRSAPGELHGLYQLLLLWFAAFAFSVVDSNIQLRSDVQMLEAVNRELAKREVPQEGQGQEDGEGVPGVAPPSPGA